MPRKRRTRRKTSTYIAVLAFLVLFCVLIFAGPLSRLSLVSPGWEIYNQVGGLRHLSQVYSTAGDFTYPKDLMGSYWKVDIDEINYGVPTMMCELGGIRHTDFAGQDIPWDSPADTREVVIGDNIYYLDRHIYTYSVTIRTIADKNPYGGGPLVPPSWEHETSWPHTYWDPIYKPDDGYTGDTFEGGFYSKFVIMPWRGASYHEPPDADPGYHYELDGAWAGVMNSYVLQRWEGQIENKEGETPDPDPNAGIRIAGGLSVGRQIPMFEDDGTFGTPAPTVEWDPTLTPDVRIESTVVQFLPIEMDPGAKLSFNIIGQIDGLWTCDVFVTYLIRVDVLQSHEFSLQVGDPPDEEDPTDYFSWALGFWDTLLGDLNPFRMFGGWGSFVAFIFLMLVIGIIVLVVLAVFAPWVLTRSARTFHDVQSTLKS